MEEKILKNPAGDDKSALLFDAHPSAKPRSVGEINVRELFPEFIGKSTAVVSLLQKVYKASQTDSPVLIYGESGTGKELVASALHRLSNRSSRQFVAINCSAIPENLLESELFGHEKGAFTGASFRRKGLFEVANGGTIFLDEIGDMPPSLQVKLLRVLQEKQFTPVGSSTLQKANVRIIAATNVNLQDAVSAKTFRLDLYFRLNVLPISIPALRDRQDDMGLLLEHFLDIMNEKHTNAMFDRCFFSESALHLLKQYSWPGNVRELQNLVERIVVMVESGKIMPSDLPEEILESHLNHVTSASKANASLASTPTSAQPVSDQSLTEPAPPAFYASEMIDPRLAQSARQLHSLQDSGLLDAPMSNRLPASGIDLTLVVETLENNYILQALEMTNNNKNQAAKLLGINRTTLVERIKKRKLVKLNSPSKEL